MGRVLSADERALWRRVTADVRANVAVEAEADRTPATKAPTLRRAVDFATNPVAPQARPARLPIQRATLDGKWDSDLKTGRVSPDRIVDLHGCTLAQAHDRALADLGDAIAMGARLVVLVTGKAPGPGHSRLDNPLRGIIRASITDWLHGAPFASRIAAIRPAHARHGGAGALYVVLRRPERS